MMFGTVIELQGFGDFDMIYTDCILVTEEKFDVKSLIRSYCSLRGIPDIKGLPENMIRDTHEDLKKWLKKQGFRELSTKKIYVCD